VIKPSALFVFFEGSTDNSQAIHHFLMHRDINLSVYTVVNINNDYIIWHRIL
jgi:hypothetical protein